MSIAPIKSVMRVSCISLVALVMVSCGKDDGDGRKDSGARPASKQAAAVRETPDLAAGLKREALQPREKYFVLDAGKGVTSSEIKQTWHKLYWSAAKKDLELLAYDVLDEFAKEDDTFRRSDIAKREEASLNKYFEDARQTAGLAHVQRMPGVFIRVHKYDATKRGFEYFVSPTMDDSPIGRRGKSTPTVASISGDVGRKSRTVDFVVVGLNDDLTRRLYVPKDEAHARELEGVLSRLRGQDESVDLAASAFGRVVATKAQLNTRVIYFFPDHLEVLAIPDNKRHGTDAKMPPVLFAIDKEQLGPVVVLGPVRELLDKK